MDATERITEWDRTTLPVHPDTTINLHVARDPSTKQPYTLVARAGDISQDRWSWADWYSVSESTRKSHKQNSDTWDEEFHRLQRTLRALERGMEKRRLDWQLEVLAELFNRAYESGDLPGSYWDLRNELRKKFADGER